MGILDSFNDRRFDTSSPLLSAMRMGGDNNSPTNRDVGMLDLTNQQPQGDQGSPQTPQGASQGYSQGYDSQQAPQMPQGGSNGPGFFTDPKNSQMLLAMAGGMGQGRSPLAGLGGAFAAGNEQLNLEQQRQQAHELAMSTLGLQKDKLSESQRLNNGKIDELSARTLKQGMPKVQNMGNGTYSVLNPGDNAPTILTDQEYRNFQVKLKQMGIEGQILAAGAGQDGKKDTAAELSFKAKAAQATQGINDHLDSLDRVEEVLKRQGAPGLWGSGIGNTVSQLLGMPEAEANLAISKLKVDETFGANLSGQGAISDFERKAIVAPLPDPKADINVWLTNIAERRKILQKARDFHIELQKAAEQPKDGLQTAIQSVQTLRDRNNGLSTQTQQPTQAYPQTARPGLASTQVDRSQPNGPMANKVTDPSSFSPETLAFLKKESPDAYAKMMGGGTAPGLAAAIAPSKPTALAMPTTKASLVSGKVYNTPRGPAIWTGSKFTQAD